MKEKEFEKRIQALTKRASKQKPKAALTIKVKTITDQELRQRTRSESKEFKQLLDVAADGKNLHITCKEYREARVLAQRIAAARSFYGQDVRIQHRGTEIFLSPRVPAIDVEEMPEDLEDPKETT